MRQVLEHAHVLIWEKQFEKKKVFQIFLRFFENLRKEWDFEIFQDFK